MPRESGEITTPFAPELARESGETATTEGGVGGSAAGLGGGAGESWPGSAGQESASMMGFPGGARTGAGPFSGRFQARLAATGLSDGGGVATAARGSAMEAMISDRASRGVQIDIGCDGGGTIGQWYGR